MSPSIPPASAHREKKAIKSDKAGTEDVPKYRELSVVSMMALFKDNAEAMLHIPNPDKLSGPVGRIYLFKILFAFEPAYMKAIVDDATAKRN